MSASERKRELRRRRHRKSKLRVFKRRVPRASNSEKEAIATKIRQLTPGADNIINSLGLG